MISFSENNIYLSIALTSEMYPQSLLLCVCMDSVSQEDLQRYQYQCMLRFHEVHELQNPSEGLLRRQMYDLPEHADDVCMWQGIECENGAITSIRWGPEMNHRWYNFAWLPSTIRELLLRKKSLNTELHMRVFPKALEHLQMNLCRLRGQPDLRALPQKLKTFDVSQNMMNGVVLLTALPESIEIVDLRHNSISGMTIMINSFLLPAGLQKVFVGTSTINWLGTKGDVRVFAEAGSRVKPRGKRR